MSDSSYSPRLRTAVLLCGTGTAGAYHAGALRALTEAGVKIDLLSGHGAGAMTALCGAIDGGAGLWDPAGPWTNARLRQSYGWRPALRTAGLGFLIALLVLLSPLVVMVFAAVAYAMSVVSALVNFPTISAWFVELYRQSLEWLFDPPVLPTAVPRAVVLALLVVVGVLVTAAIRAARQEGARRRLRGAFWWQLIGAPLAPDEPSGTLVDALWRLVRGASNEPRPAQAEIGRRYVDVLTDNFGQPGFRELLVGVHDLDARRDLVGSVLPPQAREAFEARRNGFGPREAEVVDFTGPQRELVVDFLLGALRPPIVVAPQPVQFPMDSYWRGEAHRLCDRRSCRCVSWRRSRPSASNRSCSSVRPRRPRSRMGCARARLTFAPALASWSDRWKRPCSTTARPRRRPGFRACSSCGQVTIRSARSTSAACTMRHPTASGARAS